MDNDREQVIEGRRHHSDPTRRIEQPEEVLQNRAMLLKFFVEQLKAVGFDENESVMLAAYQFNL